MTVSMKKLRQAGFAAFEAIIAILIVAALVGVGIWVMKRDNAQPSTSKTADLQENTEAPAVDSTADLDETQRMLEDANLDAGTTDNADLDKELDAF